MANNPVINSFNAGELSPYLYARNDLSKYNAGCLELENFQILPYGGATRRAAIKHVAESKQDDKVRLISFEFSSEQAYVLELGDLYMRFYKDGAQIESAPDVPYEIVTPWSAADLFRLQFVQSADVMWFSHPDYQIQRLERDADDDWSIADMVPDFPAFLDDNTTTTTIEYTGGLTVGSAGTLVASEDIFDDNHVGSYWAIKHVRTDTATSDFENSTGVGEPDQPGTTSDSVGGVGSFSFSTSGIYPAGSIIAVWRSDDDGATWEQFRSYSMESVNKDVSWEEDEAGVIYSVTRNTAASAGTFRLSINEYYTTGIVEILTVVDAKNATVEVFSEMGASGDATTRWAEGAWSAFRGYPQACSIWESRLVFAGTLNKPNTLWFSQIDAFQNFRSGVNDSDAMTVTIGSGRIDEIRWMVPQRALIIGTTGSEWVMEAESDNKPITPTSFALRRKTTYGSKSLQGVLVNSAVLFVMRQGRKLREFTYRFDVDDYVAPDLTILSEHITNGGISTLAYQQQPDNVLLSIREDGTMIPMTYERDQEVTGWYRWTVDGGSADFESVTVIPKDADEDEVWVSCKILVGGVEKRYIGVMDNREWGTNIATEWNGSDYYTVFDALEQDGWKTLRVENSSDSDFNQDYLYAAGTWTGITDNAITITKPSDWLLTDGTLDYSAQDNGEVTAPAKFIQNSEEVYDVSVAGLQGSTEWYDSGVDVNGENVYYDFSDTYAKWYDGTGWVITVVANVSGVPSDYFEKSEIPHEITVAGAGTAGADGVYTFSTLSGLSPNNGKNWIKGDYEITETAVAGTWILYDLAGANILYLVTGGGSDTPPLTGWTPVVGAPDAPTLTFTIPDDLFYGKGGWTGMLEHEDNPCVFVNPTTNTISGLDYLEGKTVDVIRDGMVEAQTTVTSGTITTQKVGQRIVVGIPYTSTLAPMYVEPTLQFQQAMGKKKGLYKAVVRFKDTVVAKVGQSLQHLRPVIFRTTGDEMDAQVDLFSGEKKISFDNEYEFLHTCYIVQDKPLPITVVAMIPYVEVKG